MADSAHIATDYEFFLCDCHSAHHGLLVERDPDIPGAYTAQLVATKSAGFWHRVKYAWRHVWRKEALVEGDIILNADEARKLSQFLTKKPA